MMRGTKSVFIGVMGCVLAAFLFTAAVVEARPKPVKKPPEPEFVWKAMIVEGNGASCSAPVGTTLNDGVSEFATETVDGQEYCGHIYTDGADARIWAVWTNSQWSVFGFHVDPGAYESFVLSGLTVSTAGATVDGFQPGKLPDCTDGMGVAECLEAFLNGEHPKGTFYDVGFAFRSPSYCTFKWDEQPIGSRVQMAISLWLEADNWQSYDCPKDVYNIVGSLDPGADCDCAEIYDPVTAWVTRLDENHWKVSVDNAYLDSLRALDCELVPLNKNRTQWVARYPVDDAEAGPFSFEILFIRELVEQ